MSSKYFGNKQDNKTNAPLKRGGRTNSRGAKSTQVKKSGRGK